MSIKKPVNSNKTLEKMSWQDQLSQIKDEFPLPLPTPQLMKEWKVYSKELQPTLLRAAQQLNVPSHAIFTYVKKYKIIAYTSGKSKSSKLRKRDYITLVKKFDPSTYRKFEYFFQDVIVSEKLDDQRKYLKQQLKQSTQKKNIASKSPALPIRHSYVVPSPLSQWRTINWADIIFEDYTIKVKYDLNFSRPFPLSESRKSFKFLTKYLLSLNRQPIKVLLVGNEIREIDNITQLKDVVTILKVRHEFIDQFEKEKSVSAKSILEIIKSLPLSFLVEIAKAASEEISCIDYLTEIQDLNFKPVPAFEIIPHGNSITTEDTFIFTIPNQDRFFLVWESTLQGRATYVFSTDLDHYELTIQNIYDYIASNQKAKRMKLRKKDIHISELNYVNFITHSSFEHWKEKLHKVISNPLQ